MNEDNHSVKMGQKVKDKVTGQVGINTAYCHYITGCDQILLQPPVNQDGSFVEARWFDVNRIDILEDVALNLKDATLNIDTSVDRGPCDPAPIK